jgi:hypothetical protein
MTNINTRLLFACYLSSVLLLLASCQKYKEKIYHFEGRLLFSNTNPIPVPSYTMDFRQSSPFSVSPGTTTTDAQGNFKCDFIAQEAKFVSRRLGQNSNLLYLEGRKNTSFTHFLMVNLPQENLGDIYLCKKIDTLIITVDAKWGLLPTDTIEIIYNTANDNLRSRASGLSASVGATNVTIDTIYNVVCTTYDFLSGRYSPDIAVFHVNQRAVPNFHMDYTDYKNLKSVEPGDEKKRVLHL